MRLGAILGYFDGGHERAPDSIVMVTQRTTRNTKISATDTWQFWNDCCPQESQQSAPRAVRPAPGSGKHAPGEVSMHIFVCNAGSSSLKFSLFEAEGERLLFVLS